MSEGIGHFTTLGEDECRDLLRTHSVARIGWQSDAGPQILPITYRLNGEELSFLTRPGGALSELDDVPVAIQLDSIDPETRTGWSVLARGRAATSAEPASEAWHGGGPQPWVADGRTLLVRIHVEALSGRIVAAD